RLTGRPPWIRRSTGCCPTLLWLLISDGGQALAPRRGRRGLAPGFVEGGDPRAGGGQLALLARRGLRLAGSQTVEAVEQHPFGVRIPRLAGQRGPELAHRLEALPAVRLPLLAERQAFAEHEFGVGEPHRVQVGGPELAEAGDRVGVPEGQLRLAQRDGLLE